MRWEFGGVEAERKPRAWSPAKGESGPDEVRELDFAGHWLWTWLSYPVRQKSDYPDSDNP